jgi:transcriptional regulator with XRE-family HTH domain
MTAGELLREARWRSGMSQRQIAAAMFVTYPAVYSAEHRGDGITVRRVRAQLAAMGYDLHLMVTKRDDG